MSLESDIRGLLGPLVADRLYPDQTPEDGTDYPCLVWTIIGGRAGWYVEGAIPDHKNARIRVWSWATSRDEANTLARQVEKTIAESTMVAEPVGAMFTMNDQGVGMYGSVQDYSIWYRDP